jgi:tetratricopeptide (TPR) repeat protein
MFPFVKLGVLRVFVVTVPFLALLAVACRAEDGRERTFVQGLELFDKARTPEEYRKAATLWESLLDEGYQNGALQYNIGNAYMRAGDYGRAIAAYRKAQRYRPRDPYLAANLEQALATAPGRLPEPPVPWWRHVFFWSGWLSYPGKFQAAFAALGLSVILAAVALLARKNRVYWASAGVLAVSVLLWIDAGITHWNVALTRHAVVVRETVARKGMDEKYEPAFDKPLKEGAEFTIVNESEGWVLGRFEGIGDGWLKKDAVVE